jgi:ABC-type enterochelin transport system permease subunit
MNSPVSTSALFKGSVVAGLSAALVGPIAFFTYNVAMTGAMRVPSSDDVKGSLFLGIILGCIGIAAALVAGFPLLLALRKFNRLSLVSATLAGAVLGLVTSVLLWAADSFRPPIFPLGCLIGALCGWIAMRVSGGRFMRPNKSLERTREG